MKVLVTDGEQRAALAVVRSLGRQGREVIVVASSRRSLAAASRFARRSLILPDPLASPSDFGAALVETVRAEGIAVVLPIADASLEAALTVRPDLETAGALLPFADRVSCAAVSDKKLVLERARGFGIAVPRQVVIHSPAELEEAAPLTYPLVVKPHRSVVEGPRGTMKVAVRHAGSTEELARILADLPPAGYPVLLQERIVGPGIGIFLLRWNGTTAAAFAHRRLREKPPAGGVSVLCESVPLDAGLYDRSVALLDSFAWKGPAMVEYKVDSLTGTPYLMEVNGRYWGSLQLAIDAGVDFPAIHVDVAVGAPPSPVAGFRTEVRTRWLLGDVDHLLARLRRSRAALDLPEDSPGRMRAIGEFLASFGPGTRNEVFRWSDPMPAVAELIGWGAGIFRRAWRWG